VVEVSLKILSILLIAIGFVGNGCKAQGVSSQIQNSSQSRQTTAQKEAPQQKEKNKVEYKEVGEYEIFYVENFKYGKYKVEKKIRKAKLYDDVTHKVYGTANVEYAVLKRNGKVIAKFDDGISETINQVEFGWFSFIGNYQKQLLVSQNCNKCGRHWIVSVSPKYKVIFDSAKFGVGFEYIGIVDIDGDGVFEVWQVISDFYYFRGSRKIPAVALFKYDKRKGRYVLANKLFPNYLLKDIEENKKEIKESTDLLEAVLEVMLDYIYAGKEKEAWEFYERNYDLPDKKEVKDDIKATLNKEAIYQMLYKRKAK
jgi:hypothetical protein